MGAVLLATDDDTSALAAALSADALRAGLSGLVMGLVAGPVLAWLRPPVWSGPITGALASLAGTFTYFWLWPHAWQPTRWEAWKSLATVVNVYWPYLVPVALLAGCASHAWLRASPAVAVDAYDDLEDPGSTEAHGAGVRASGPARGFPPPTEGPTVPLAEQPTRLLQPEGPLPFAEAATALQAEAETASHTSMEPALHAPDDAFEEAETEVLPPDLG